MGRFSGNSVGRRGRRPVRRCGKLFGYSIHGPARVSGPYRYHAQKTQNSVRGNFTFSPPAHRIPGNLSSGLVGAASPGGPPSYAEINKIQGYFVQRTRRGRRPRRPVPVNIRAVNQRWTGRPGGRPLQKRKNLPLRNSMVPRAAVGGGPYGVMGSCSGIRYTGRPVSGPYRYHAQKTQYSVRGNFTFPPARRAGGLKASSSASRSPASPRPRSPPG